MSTLIEKFSANRVHYFHYDSMCRSPEREIHFLKRFLAHHGICKCDERLFAINHASDDRHTIARMMGSRIQWTPIAPFDEEEWQKQIEIEEDEFRHWVSKAKTLENSLIQLKDGNHWQ